MELSGLQISVIPDFYAYTFLVSDPFETIG